MDGILCLDKPDTMTSFACCAVLRRLVGEKKAGHTGTLDPMATGVLPVLFGRATRAIPFLPVQDKRYTATLTFGYRSDTLDIWGKVEATGAPVPSPRAVEAALPAFRGEIRQVPPMMSALKRDGVRLYDLARRGIEVEREARPVTVRRLDILEYDPGKGILLSLIHIFRPDMHREGVADRKGIDKKDDSGHGTENQPDIAAFRENLKQHGPSKQQHGRHDERDDGQHLVICFPLDGVCIVYLYADNRHDLYSAHQHQHDP